ncbi:MAG: CHAD domain-containing protein [Gammaproteobacteria bacterium]|nr:CHAD domain-containing protein [Gammaproteobacteria bacterium]
MAFRLATAQPLAAALKQAARTELDAAQAEAEADVHEARKRCKKLRAWLRLLHDPLDARYAPLESGLRAVAHRLSGQRVLEALVETWPELGAGLPPRLRQRCGAGLERHVRRELAALRRPAGAARSFERLRGGFDGLILTGLSADDLATGLCDTYRRARRRYRRAGETASAADLHAWRKHAKYHGYQCALVAPLWPRLGRRVKRLKQLSDLLGRHHDLEELIALLQAHPARFGGKAAVAQIVDHLRERQGVAADAALELGKTLFDRKTRPWWRAQGAPAGGAS